MTPRGASSDCAETRALIAILVQNEERARSEIRSLSRTARIGLARAARRLAQLCEDPATDRYPWER